MCAGHRRHYHLHEIAPRHFEQTAHEAGLPTESVAALLAEITDRFNDAWAEVQGALPVDFPDGLAASIRNGMAARAGL